MKVVAIVGSISEKSHNRKIANFLKERYKDKLDIDVMTFEDLPMYNEDIEMDPPAIVEDFRKRIRDSEGIIFVTPEYNHTIPGVLKNALDWFSRVERVLFGKPSMIVGGSMGFLGTVKAQIHLRQILNSPGIGTINLPGNEVFINGIHEKLDEDGNFNHEPTIKFLDTVIDEFIAWAKKVS